MSMVHDREPAGSHDRLADSQTWLPLYRALLTAREIEHKELELVRRGLAFFHVSGAGHEGTASLAAHLLPEDWLHCHYRDKALLLARGLPIREFFLSLLCRAGSHSAGRQMSAHLSCPELNVLSIVGPVGNNALQAVGVSAELKHRGRPGLVVCSTGEGTSQQGEFLEAIAEAVRDQLPVLFLVQDNGWAISTATRGRTLFSLPDGPAEEFYGLPIRQVDGRDPIAAHEAFGETISEMRDSGRPALVWFQVQRLADHSNADDQTLYRDVAEIAEANRAADPVQNLRQQLLDLEIDSELIEELEHEVKADVAAAVDQAVAAREPAPCFEAKRPIDQPPQATGSVPVGPDERLPMGQALNKTLRHLLQSDERVVLVGEDIEDPKGDVFGVTRGLGSEFPGRVQNSALSESTIVGVSLGRALAGARPIAFLQFADFLPLAYNQLASELGSMYWRTAGAWQAPVIVMITCGGYKPGLGPFHSQTLESVAAHIPGVDVVMPSTAGDAAGLLNAAFASGRPTLFFYPKSCLNLAEQATSANVAAQFVPLGACRTVRAGADLTFVSWGYPVLLCEKAAAALAEQAIEAEVLDLRSLSPWDEAAVCASAEKTGRLVVVHEDNSTCGFGAEVIATVAERVARPVQCRRVARPDTWVPCHFPSQLAVLPSFHRVLTTAADLFDFDVTWENEPQELSGTMTVDALGSGPADESVIITDVLVQPGTAVAEGDVVAIAEAQKSIVEISANVAGVVEEVLAAVGDSILVGRPLVRIRLKSAGTAHKALTHEQCGRPILKRRSLVVPPLIVPPSGGLGEPQTTSIPEPAKAGTMSVPPSGGTYRDMPISPRQQLLNRRMEQSLQSVPQGDMSIGVPREKLAAATEKLRANYRDLPIGEFDVLSFCAAQAAALSPRVRSSLLSQSALREFEGLNLGIAVHLEGDDLATAVIGGADRLSFPEFVSAMRRQIELARCGNDQAAADVQLLVTHLGGLPITAARPVLIAPAAAILFIGSPSGSPGCEFINVTLGFDHRILNGVAAARFLAEMCGTVERLGESPHSQNGEARRNARGDLRRALEETPRSERHQLVEDHVRGTISRLLAIEAGRIDPNGPLRNQGLQSIHAAELAVSLGESLRIAVPPTLVWNRPTIREIAAFLLEHAGKTDELSSTPASNAPADDPLLAEIGGLSDEQVRALLDLLPGKSEQEKTDRMAS